MRGAAPVCRVCVPVRPEGALDLVRGLEAKAPRQSVTGDEWLTARAARRGPDFSEVL
jgi:hypothetical protein